jgi:iron complex outermembrane recepter protein
MPAIYRKRALPLAALSGEQAAALGQRSLENLVAQVPNVGFTTSSSGNNLTVRGVGSPALDNVQSSVATFIDGVYITRSRNASAPLFGKNSIAGVFNIVTAKPTQDFEGLVDLRAGNYNSHEGTLVLSGGLTDTLSARVATFNRRTGDYLQIRIVGHYRRHAFGFRQQIFQHRLSRGRHLDQQWTVALIGTISPTIATRSAARPAAA